MQIAMFGFAYYLNRAQGYNQAEAFTTAVMVSRIVITQQVKQSIPNWDNGNVQNNLNRGTNCQHRKKKSTPLDARK